MGRDPGEIDVTWMAPLILTTSEQNTGRCRTCWRASAPAEETAAFAVGQPGEVPDLVAAHVAAGADEVIFSFAFADPAGIAAVGEALGLPGA